MWPFSNKTVVCFEDLASCHICGCLLVKNRHTQGKPEIITKIRPVGHLGVHKETYYETEERYYCRAHMPIYQK